MHTPPLILVVDDDPTNQEVLLEALSESHTVLVAGTADEALRIALAHAPDIVIADVVLPGMDGYELCQTIRAMPGMEFTAIVIASARAMASDRERGMRAGADAYLTKPFAYSELVAAIHELTELRTRRAEQGARTVLRDAAQRHLHHRAL